VFHPQRVLAALDGMLGRRVSTLQRHRQFRYLAAATDGRAAPLLQVPGGCHLAVHDTLEVGIEQPAPISERHIFHPAENRHTRVVDPRIKDAKAFLRDLGWALHLRHQARPAAGRHACSDKTNATDGSGDHDHLLLKILESNAHAGFMMGKRVRRRCGHSAKGVPASRPARPACIRTQE
jgi:hypothetical protein